MWRSRWSQIITTSDRSWIPADDDWELDVVAELIAVLGMGWRDHGLARRSHGMKPTPRDSSPRERGGRWAGMENTHSREEAEALAACFRPPTRVVETGSPGVHRGRLSMWTNPNSGSRQ